MSQTEKAANAVSGRTARACDSCLRRRARWYCAADDAFLCQACDASVHSANPLARRHDRVRLKTASSSPLSLPPADLIDSATPAWHRGFKRKARTPRHGKNSAAKAPVTSLVPDLDEGEVEEEEEQLLYQVPVFDPVVLKFKEAKAAPAMISNQIPFGGFGPSDLELAEFAADVENLLGQGLDDDAFCIDGLGLLEAREYGDVDRSQVKTEIADGSNITLTNGVVNDTAGDTKFLVDMEMEFSRESLDFNFDCGSAGEEVEEKKVETGVGLRLDYEAVIAEWSCRGCSPWTDGEQPQYNLHDCWPDFTGLWGSGGEQQGMYGEIGIGAQVGNSDGGREARVSRYREKRRTRLFSKKIRYEVRKLNAEKRPRMKGRFVKRASFPAAAASVAVAAAGGGATASSTGAFAFV